MADQVGAPFQKPIGIAPGKDLGIEPMTPLLVLQPEVVLRNRFFPATLGRDTGAESA